MIVLDAHIWIRWISAGLGDLPPRIADAITKSQAVGVSAISCLEVAQLHKRGRIELNNPPREWVKEALEGADIEMLPVTCEIAQHAVDLPDHPKDPADRIIIATAIAYGADLASLDEKVPLYHEIAARLLK